MTIIQQAIASLDHGTALALVNVRAQSSRVRFAARVDFFEFGTMSCGCTEESCNSSLIATISAK